MCGYLFAFLAVIQMAAFFLYWQTTEHLDIKWLVYLVYWIRNLSQTMVPLLTAVALLLLFRAGHRKLWLFAILPALSPALYYLPDHYLYYLAAELDSAEALAMGGLMTLLECIGIYTFVLLLYFIAKSVFVHITKKKTEDLSEEVYPLFDLQDPMTKSVFFASFANFCLQIIIEIIRTISYLVSNSGTYTFEEILTILLSFVMHLAVLLASHAFCMLYLRYADKHYRIEE